MLFMASHITADETGITVRKLFGERRAVWDEISGVESGGGNLVIRLHPRGRVVAPSFEFWSGTGKRELIQFVAANLAQRGVQITGSVKAVFLAGDRER